LAADDADIGMTFGLGGEMLAGTEANLEPDGADLPWKQRAGVERSCFRESHRQLRQQFLFEPPLPRPQRPPASPAVAAPAPHALNRCAFHMARFGHSGPPRRA